MGEPLKVPWSPLEAMGVIVVSLLATLVATAGFALVADSQGTALILGGLVYEACLAGVSVLWVRTMHRTAFAALGLRTLRPLRDAWVGFVSGIGIFGVVVLVVAPLVYLVISVLAGRPVTPPAQDVLPADPGTAQIALQGFAVVVAAPIGEEIFFRGFLHGALRARAGFGFATTVSSVVFAVFHLIPLLMPLFFVVGFGLAWLYERRGSLVACMVAHAAFNAIGYSYIVRAAS